jgi:hypothetical protein
MSDSYPTSLPIEIDRPQLQKYLGAKWLFAWLMFFLFFGTLFGLTAAVDELKPQNHPRRGALLLLFLRDAGLGLGISGILALLCWAIFSRPLAKRIATSLQVQVEGAFLRVREHGSARTDRKLHFSAIVDYSTTSDRLMRYFGIKALVMSTTGGGMRSMLIIHGVKDCLRVRDMLSEIDHLREKT